MHALYATLLLASPLNLKPLFDPNAEGPIHDERAYQRAAQHQLLSGPHDRPATIDVDNYDLSIKVEPTLGTVEGQVLVQYRSLAAALDTVELDAVDLQIAAVEDASGAALPFDYDGKLLRIHLAAAVAGGERSQLTVHYKALIPQVLFLTGPQPADKAQMQAAYTYTEPEGAREWFPCVDRPSDKATASVTVTVPAGFKALANGDLLGTAFGQDGTTFRYRMDQNIATYLVSLAIGPYVQVDLGAAGSKPVRIWAPPALAEKAAITAAHTTQMMAAYAAFTGVEYPFNSYTMSVAEAYGTSMEHQSATTMGGTRITGDESGEGVVAHELGHQWFGDLVTCRNWGEVWLNEGFASYLPYVYFAQRPGAEPRAIGQIDSWRGGYFSESAKYVHPLSSPDPDFSQLFDAHAYDKGALVIHLMRHVANAMPAAAGAPEAFSRALKLYLTRNGQDTATSYELQRALEETTGQSWQLFFDQWVRSAGHPELKLSTSWADGTLTVDLEQLQATRADRRWRTFTFPLDLELIDDAGAAHTVTLDVYDEHQTFKLPLSHAPLAVSVDPHAYVPATVAFAQPVAAWTAILAHSPAVESRLNALNGLYAAAGNTLPDDAVALVRADKARFIQISAMDLLSQRPEDREKVALIYRDLAGALLFEEDVSVRQAVASTEAWLVTTLATTPTRDQEAQWQRRYLQTNLVTERKSLLDMLAKASPERAQEFVLARTEEADWTTADRRSFISQLTRAVTPTTLAFIKDSLAGASPIYNQWTIGNLANAKVDSPELVPVLVDGARTNRSYEVRAAMASLLGQQTSSKAAVCPELAALAAGTDADPLSGVLDQVHAAAAAAAKELGCDAR